MPRIAPPRRTSRARRSPPAIEHLDAAVARVGSDLAGSFQALLERLPGAPHRPQELARKLGINKDLSSRILKATETMDPIAVAHVIPGPEPLRRLLRAAARKNVDPQIVSAAEDSVRHFETLIRTVAGDRGGLDTIISAWLPEAREKAELLSKQAVFKGMSQIRGSSTETDVTARFVHPARSGKDHDLVSLDVSVGVRRLRPGAVIAAEDIDLRPSKDQTPLLTLDGEAVNDRHDVMLAQFCSSPAPRFDIRREDGATHLILEGDEVGLQSTVDLAWAFVKRDCRTRGVFTAISTPLKRQVCDLFLHASARPKAEPVLEIYDTAIKGVAKFRDPARALDRLEIKAGIDYLGQGVSKFRCTDAPRYTEMINHVCEKMDWDASQFHGYRCVIDYPVYGSQICMAIDQTPDTTTTQEPAGAV